uniref:RNase H type-1 domain-containing protein n=1 Tax=Cannabis sativa TaxID=3483 RepID=A0A803QEE6_CANSA
MRKPIISQVLIHKLLGGSSFGLCNSPQKVKIFAWRVIHNALPVATSLVRRKISTDSTCSVCKKVWESIGHALFGCKYAKAEMEQIIWTFWSIWTERNRVVHGFTTKPAPTLASFAVNYLSNFWTTKGKYHNAASNNPIPAQVAANAPWKPPTGTNLKLNVDAALDANRNIIGVGVVVRNSAGRVLAALAKLIIGNFASHEMEANVMFHSLNWVIQLQLPIGIVETDALLVANALQKGSTIITYDHDLLIDVSSLLSFFPQVNIVHAKRSANMVAHCLAKFVLGVDETCSWLEDLPLPFYFIIVNNIPV